MKKFLLTLLIIIAAIGIYAYLNRPSNKPMTINPDAIQKLQEFKDKEKFVEDDMYTGLGNPSLKPKLSEDLNKTADDFITTVQKGGSEADFLIDIKNGLARFNPVEIGDTEDRERIAMYFEQLMDAVGLESSNGQLNEWMYEFNPENN